MKKFVDEMDSSFTKIGLIPFASSVNCPLSLTDDFRKVKQAIDKLNIGEYGYVSSAHPFDLAYAELANSCADVKYIIVLTDGIWDCTDKAINSSRKCHSDGIEVMAIGFGTANYSFLKKIASTDEYASLTDLSKLGGSFSKIAQAIGDSSTSISIL